MDRLYSVIEATEQLSITKNKLYDLVRYGYIKPIKCDSIKIPSTEIDNFIGKWTGWDLSDLDNPKKIEYSKEES